MAAPADRGSMGRLDPPAGLGDREVVCALGDMRVHGGHLPAQRVTAGSQRTPETDDHRLLVGRIVDEFPGWDHRSRVTRDMDMGKGRDHALGIIEPDFAHRPLTVIPTRGTP